MAQLHILSLTCLNQQDIIGGDEPRLQIGGVTVFGPQPMSTGDVVNPNVLQNFVGALPVTLIEVDIGGNDNLGTVVVPDTLAGLGDETGHFHALLPNAHYHMTYHVHP